MQLSFSSSVFDHGGEIPSHYTCDGEDVSPPLQWSGVPAGARSLVLIVDDPDASLPRGEEYFGYGSVEQVETVDLRAGASVPISATWSGGGGFGALRIGVRGL